MKGENDRAFAWLERAYLQHSFDLRGIPTDPFLKKLAADARYATFLRKMNLRLVTAARNYLRHIHPQLQWITRCIACPPSPKRHRFSVD